MAMLSGFFIRKKTKLQNILYLLSHWKRGTLKTTAITKNNNTKKGANFYKLNVQMVHDLLPHVSNSLLLNFAFFLMFSSNCFLLHT